MSSPSHYVSLIPSFATPANSTVGGRASLAHTRRRVATDPDFMRSLTANQLHAIFGPKYPIGNLQGGSHDYLGPMSRESHVNDGTVLNPTCLRLWPTGEPETKWSRSGIFNYRDLAGVYTLREGGALHDEWTEGGATLIQRGKSSCWVTGAAYGEMVVPCDPHGGPSLEPTHEAHYP